ncbi:MAG: AraC family transcriptional regulator [Bacteroidales bacterium]|nr:AraC family transcriptional regulator [Bacteroidales bacterium]MDD4739957.1 AraC family transcriptional regulator [Bacteroidales bacterium]
MDIHIKNMVCNRCIMVVSDIFKDAGIVDARVELGKVSLPETPEQETRNKIEKELQKAGFEIIEDTKSRMIEDIKKEVIDIVYYHTDPMKVNFSAYLADKLNKDYNYLSSLFSSVVGTTIEKYLINLRIERVKELLVYDDKTLSEIAYEMGYSSVAHLSGQFKRITGFTPSWFKKLADKKRVSIDKI